jgi:hypothetical protein
MGEPYRIRHHSCGPKFGRNPITEVTVLSCHVATNSVVSCECPRTVGAGYTDTLMSLANVSS